MSSDDMRFIVARVYGPNAKEWKRKVAKMTDVLYIKAWLDKVVPSTLPQ